MRQTVRHSCEQSNVKDESVSHDSTISELREQSMQRLASVESLTRQLEQSRSEETPADVQKREARELGLNSDPKRIPPPESAAMNGGISPNLLSEDDWISANATVQAIVTAFQQNMESAESMVARASTERSTAITLKAEDTRQCCEKSA